MKETIIACDFQNKEELDAFLAPFGEERLFLKIGMELYYHEGKALIKELKAKGHKIFLDLKLHDIPNTVAKSLKSLQELSVDFITIHAGGGANMLRAAAEVVKGTETKLLAVTILTSIDEEMLRTELMITETLENVVTRYALMAYKAGINGCICSPYEVDAIQRLIADENFVCVTPGIRLSGDAAGDQSRIATPTWAFEQGASAIVVGRSITESKTPYTTYKNIKEDVNHV